MKILIINPNSDTQFSDDMQTCGREFAKGRYQVDACSVPTAPHFIETYYDQEVAIQGMLKIIKAKQDEYDAFIIACHCDPGLNCLKECTDKLVIGIGEASMKIATMLGDSFSVLSFSDQATPMKRALIRSYGIENSFASVQVPAADADVSNYKTAFLSAGKRALDEDRAEVLVLGCGGLTNGVDKAIQKELGVPVLDGVICALILATGLVEYGVSQSKYRRWHGGETNLKYTD